MGIDRVGRATSSVVWGLGVFGDGYIGNVMGIIDFVKEFGL